MEGTAALGSATEATSSNVESQETTQEDVKRIPWGGLKGSGDVRPYKPQATKTVETKREDSQADSDAVKEKLAVARAKEKAKEAREEPKAEATKELKETSDNESKPKLTKMKMGSKEYDVPEELVTRLKDMERANHARAQQIAAEAKRREQELFEKLDIEALAKAKGINVEEWAEQRLLEVIKRSEMTETERKLMEYEQKFQAIEREKQEAEARRQAEENEKVYSETDRQVKTEFMQAWQKSGLPPTKRAGVEFARVMYTALARGEPLTPEEAADKVKQDYINDTKSLFESADAKVLYEFFGDSIVKKFRNYDLERVTEASKNQSNKPRSSDGKFIPSASKQRQVPIFSESQSRDFIEWKRETGGDMWQFAKLKGIRY